MNDYNPATDYLISERAAGTLVYGIDSTGPVGFDNSDDAREAIAQDLRDLDALGDWPVWLHTFEEAGELSKDQAPGDDADSFDESAADDIRQGCWQ